MPLSDKPVSQQEIRDIILSFLKENGPTPFKDIYQYVRLSFDDRLYEPVRNNIMSAVIALQSNKQVRSLRKPAPADIVTYFQALTSKLPIPEHLSECLIYELAEIEDDNGAEPEPS